MMIAIIKMAVGLLLMISFACPLAVVALNSSLWDEPMVLFVTNLAVADFALGLSLTSIGLVDMLLPRAASTPCAWVMFTSYGIAMMIKMAHLLLAVDQFIAVRFSLRYYELMERIVRKLLAATWTVALLHIVYGKILFNFDLETVADRLQVVMLTNRNDSMVTNGTQQLKGCRYETIVPIIYHDMFEVEVIGLSLSSAGLFIYTAFVGMRQKARIGAAQTDASRDLESQSFFANYRAFRKLLRVILLTLTLDCLALVQRRVSLSYPMPQISGLVHQLRLSLIVTEFWVYAVASVKLRAAFKKTLGCGICCAAQVDSEDYPGPGHVHGGGADARAKSHQSEVTPWDSHPGLVAVVQRQTSNIWDEPDQHSQPIAN